MIEDPKNGERMRICEGQPHLLITSYFRAYYLHSNLAPLKLRFRQIKIHSFDNGWIIPQRSIPTERKLLEYVNKRSNPPSHVYSTLLRFLDANQLTTKRKLAICLSGPYVVDFDLQGHILYFRKELEGMKNDILDVADLLHDWYGVSEFSYVFSGHRGFHLYVNDFPLQCLKSSIWGYHREGYERQQRYRITWQLRRVGIVFDYPISTDTRRIIRIPGTLHGATGLRCFQLDSEAALWKFQPEDAQINLFRGLSRHKIPVIIVRNLPPFEWDSHEYSGKRNDELLVPISLAVLLLLQQDVIVRDDSFFAELPELTEKN